MDDLPDTRRGTDFDLLAGQFFCTKGPAVVPATWLKDERDGWHLVRHPLLPLVPLRARDNTQLGWLVGHAISQEAEILDGPQTVPVASRTDVDAAAFEDWLYALSGRFVAILLTDQHARLYLDPCGTLASVYAKDGQAFGSTTSILEAVGAVEQRATKPANLPLQPNQFHPAGLTSHPAVRRLMPNHYLDLNHWSAVRHWLHETLGAIAEDDLERHADLFFRDLQRTITAVAKQYPVYLCQTAGRDSRMLLACAHEALRKLTLVTYEWPTRAGRVDVQVARTLAQKVGLRQVVVPVPSESTALRDEYLYRIGFDGHWGKARKFLEASRTNLDLGNALLLDQLSGNRDSA